MEKFMKGVAAVKAGEAVLKDDIPMPVLKDYECLVKIHTCGFCNGTDMQIIHGTLTEDEGMMPFPTVLGHEGAGEVIEIGNKVRYIALGDRLIRPDTPKWYGKYSCTFGTMAEYAVAIDRKAMIEDGIPEEQMPDEGKCEKIPNDISFEDAAVMLSLLECISAVHNFGLKQDMNVLIYGAGPMGMGVANYLKIIGAHVVLVDGIQKRLDYAKEHFGIEQTIHIQTQKLSEFCRPKSFDAVMDIVGATGILLEGTNYLKQGGILCSMGVLKDSDAVLNLLKLQNNTRLHMLNLPYKRMDYMDELVRLIREGKIVPRHYYSHVLPAEKISECIELIRSKDALKVVLSFE